MKKKLVVTDKKGCMACLGSVLACSAAFYKVDDVTKSCIQIVTDKDGDPKPNVCIQCGKCMKECPSEAISQNAKGVYVIDKKKCTGCGKCAEVCPTQVMVVNDDLTSKCIACGICAKACPAGILEVQEKE